MKKIILISFLLVSFTMFSNAPYWGETGHRTMGKIAQKHLKRRVKKKINKLLQGESLAFVSTYGDEIKSDKRYKKFFYWHFVNMPLNETYKQSKKNPKGDLITGINYCIKVLKNENSSDDDKRFYLKLLVHLIGDMHQPMHVGLKEDLGGNRFQVRWHHEGSNLHRVWDSDMIEQWNMSYIELADNAKCLTKKQVKEIKKGTFIDWLEESHKITRKIYANVKKGDKLGYRYSYEWFPVVREQLQKSGIRLAKVLNDIFG